MENQEKLQPNIKDQKMTTSTAIIVAAVIIMIGILLSKGGLTKEPKTLSEQVGVSKDKLNTCIKETDIETLNTEIASSVDKAMSNVAQRGTPYSVIIGPNGFMTDIRGAESLVNTQAIVKAAQEGKLATTTSEVKQKDGSTKNETMNLSEIYKGNIDLPEESKDHILGNPNAPLTIVEYSDFECPYCKQYHAVLKKIVQESDGSVRWVYRHYPLHQHSFEKLVAADCIAKIKGNDAFWKYSDLLFGLLKTANDSVSEQL